MPQPIPSPDLPPVDRLRAIMHTLRAPGGCPWDAEQTHESLLKHLIEEAYEVAEAVSGGDRDEIVDELGDLLLQPVFHAEIGAEAGTFDLDDVANAICEKLIRRHPHVFGDSDVSDSDGVLSQWDQIKKQEKAESTGSGTGLNPVKSESKQGYFVEKVNVGLPALMAAEKLQRKVAKVGFDWPDLPPVLDKIREETEEVAEALESGDEQEIASEIGDLLFAVVNLARKTGHDSELLLMQANRKFLDRFQKMEDLLAAESKTVHDSDLEEMDAAWERAKRA